MSRLRFKEGDRVLYRGLEVEILEIDVKYMPTYPYMVELHAHETTWVREDELEEANPFVPELPPAHTLTGKDRKQVPVYHGVLMYFPKAIQEIARLSYLANEQHNPGTPMHWDRSKSGDELDAGLRHGMGAGTFDDDGHRHSTKFAWRTLANLEKELEAAEAE